MPSTSWAQIERLSAAYRRKPGCDTAAKLDRCLRKAAPFTDKITRFYVRSHAALVESSVVFCMSDGNGAYPDYACEYDPVENVFQLNTVGVLEFRDSCGQSEKLLVTSEGRENFAVYRLNAYKAELQKLPTQLLMFLLLFQEKARVLEVTQVERRRNAVKREDDKSNLEYLNFLWAFRELEGMYHNLSGNNLRSDTRFTWFESEWVSGAR